MGTLLKALYLANLAPATSGTTVRRRSSLAFFLSYPAAASTSSFLFVCSSPGRSDSLSIMVWPAAFTFRIASPKVVNSSLSSCQFTLIASKCLFKPLNRPRMQCASSSGDPLSALRLCADSTIFLNLVVYSSAGSFSCCLWLLSLGSSTSLIALLTIMGRSLYPPIALTLIWWIAASKSPSITARAYLASSSNDRIIDSVMRDWIIAKAPSMLRL